MEGFYIKPKEAVFYDKLTEQQLRKIHGERLNDDDWNKLKEYWASEESEVSTTNI